MRIVQFRITLFVIIFFAFLPFVSGEELDIKPVPVSPGQAEKAVMVETKCPTFSWTQVPDAVGYKIVVFQSNSNIRFSYEELSALKSPVLNKNIKGRAFSWTPSSAEGLESGSVYIWFVKGIDRLGGGAWSEGRRFRVEPPVFFAEVEGELREKLKEEGLSDQSINDVFAGVNSNDKDKNNLDNDSPEETTATEGTSNTFFGYNAGNGTMTGIHNSLFGPYAGNDITTGSDNSFFGFNAGDHTTTGTGNNFFGMHAGTDNTTGSYNIFIGDQAGYNNHSGNSNIFIGYTAGYFTTAGSNIFIGHNAGKYNTSGNPNTFIGYEAGSANTIANHNTFVGYQTGTANTGGYDNIFIGYQAGLSNTSGDNNTFIGSYAGQDNTSGLSNTFIGRNSGANVSTGSFNTLYGAYTGFNITSGINNTYIGYEAGNINVTGSSNVYLGYKAGFYASGSNKLYISNSGTGSPLIYGEFDNKVVRIHGNLQTETTGTPAVFQVERTDGSTLKLAAGVANTQIGSISNHGIKFTTNNVWKMKLNAGGTLDMADGGSYNGTWNDASSIEFKENIRELSPDEAVCALSELRPVLYNYKKHKDEERVGFIAEHVPEIVANGDRKNLSAMDIVAVLTKVVKEQQKLISDLKNSKGLQQKTIDALEKRVNRLEIK